MKKRFITVLFIFVFVTILCSCGSFSIKGKWKNVGSGTFGQAQTGSIVIFNDNTCNLFSPVDTYAFYKEGSGYKLDITGLLGGDMTFDVKVKNNDNIIIKTGSNDLELKRVQ